MDVGLLAFIVTERQSHPATDFFSSEAKGKLTSRNPSVQLYLAETNSATYLQKEVEQLASGSILWFHLSRRGRFLLTSLSLLLPKGLNQWRIAERKAYTVLTCLLTCEIIFPLYAEFAHCSSLCIISTMGLIVIFSFPSHFWAQALLRPLAELVQNNRTCLDSHFPEDPGTALITNVCWWWLPLDVVFMAYGSNQESFGL